jgi:multicomponent Na+:H+ antiporter subunit E
MKELKGILLVFIFLFAVWVLLTGIGDPVELLVGAVLALGLAAASGKARRAMGDFRLTPKSIAYAVVYPFVFLRELVSANLDVAARVVNPRLPVNPAIVRVRTNLKSPLGRTILANSITLTPGTITVETRDEVFYVHWIDRRGRDTTEATAAIVSKFEKYLEVIFG